MKFWAVVNPTITWARLGWLAAFLVTGAVSGWVLWEYPREVAELGTLVVLEESLRRTRRHRRDRDKAEGDWIELQTRFEDRVAEEVASMTEGLVAENANLSLRTDEAVAQATEAAAKVAAVEKERDEAIKRLDLSGQFVAVALRWVAATKTKKSAPVIAGIKLDATYWWSRLEAIAKQRWPGHRWVPDELQSVALELATEFDLRRWRQVVNSEFGLTLNV